MQQCLALAWAAIESFWRAIFLYLRDVAANGSPAADLSIVVQTAASVKITAIPLKPSSRVFVVYPAVLAPNDERLRCVYTEKIELWIMPFRAEFCFVEPVRWKFAGAISHILTSKNSKCKHLFRGKLRLKSSMKIPTHRLDQQIRIILLHLIVNFDPTLFHI